jgi:hypothetical protein
MLERVYLNLPSGKSSFRAASRKVSEQQTSDRHLEQQPIVRHNPHFIPAESKTSVERSDSSSLQARAVFITGNVIAGLLSIVEQAHPPIGHVDAEVSFLRHEQIPIRCECGCSCGHQ